MEYGETAKLFKALGDENRLRILSMLQSGERCACVLLEYIHLSQPTLSHHMKILCEAGLVTGRKEENGCITPELCPGRTGRTSTRRIIPRKRAHSR